MPRSHPRRALGALAVLFSLIACQTPVDLASPSLTPSSPRAVSVPAQGTATTLDIGNWNIEWFGDAANGPTNETLQQSNVRDVIASADVDIWGLEEVVTAAAWNSLKAGLPGYAGVLSSDANVVSGSAYYTSTEQKVAVLYKTSVASLVSAKLVCTASDYAFAGRPPLEVTLNVTLNGTTQPLVLIVLHNKAFNDVTSWQRRKDASTCLKSYLDTTYPTQRVMVVGDWNDDVDTSITAGEPTPFANLLADPARYTFPTKALSDAGIASTVSYSDFIDHQLASNEQMADYVSASAHVVRADQYVTSYGTTTTDHYPVVSSYQIGGSGNTAPTVTVTSPNGGESWAAGTVHAITWSSANVSSVNLDYSVDGGSTWTAIATGVAASPASFSWTVPNSTTTTGRVRVSDAASSTSDVSDASFTIVATTTPAKVIINEIMANEPGSSTAGEYVELVNVGGTAQSIAGWTISDATAVRHTFAAGTTLNPGKAIVVFAAASGIPAGTPNAIASSTGVFSFANGGDSVILKNGAATVDSFTYPSSLAAQDGVSMNRSPDVTAGAAFVLHNTISARASSPGVKADGTSY